MINDNIKIRVSRFIYEIVLSDMSCYNFLKNDYSPNFNAFFNKLIPNLLLQRKQRRKMLENNLNEVLEFHGDNLQERIRQYLSSIMDKIYFIDEDFQKLNNELWIRPNRSNLQIFEEIEEFETKITQQNFSTCLRSMINEYCKMPQYKREQILFSEEYALLSKAFANDFKIRFMYDDEIYIASLLMHVPEYTYLQENHIFCYDTERNKIVVVKLFEMKNLFIIEERYQLQKNIIEKMLVIRDSLDFYEKDIFEVGDN